MMNKSVLLGGKAVIVEIDESKFGKMKYERSKLWKDSGCLVALKEK